MSDVVIDLVEWQEVTPAIEPRLRGVCVPDDAQTRRMVESLDRRSMLVLLDGRDGLSVRATSFVGSLNLGAVTIRVRPKVTPRLFATLVGYAFRLHELTLFSEHDVALRARAFQDLLVQQFCGEAARIIGRGLYRQYADREQALRSPRGRVVFGVLARRPITQAALACRHHVRTDDALQNRVLLSGLVLAATLGIDVAVRRRARSLAAQLSLTVTPVRLDHSTFSALGRRSTRLTTAYEPAIALIRLLVAGQGVSTDREDETIRLPGFLFDMNLLFQEVIGRFLREWLVHGEVEEQHRLRQIFCYEPAFNPRNRGTPTPRPDYVVRTGRQIAAILDAKYRDLWDTPLPREMLYQLTVYALSQASCTTATILYPSASVSAREARIAVRNPLSGLPRGRVSLRPVPLETLGRLVSAPRTAVADRARRAFASYLVSG